MSRLVTLMIGMGLLTAVISPQILGDSGSADNNWAMWRGPEGTGAAPENCNPPTTWSEKENVKWKVKLPGQSHSSPIIWGDKIFFQTAIAVDKKVETASSNTGNQQNQMRGGQRQMRGRNPMGIGAPSNEYKFDLVCLDRKTGKLLWQKTARQELPHEGTHQEHGFSSYSPVTDGKNIWASFGSRGLHCFDMDGNLKWSKDLGKMNTRMSFGEGSSPTLAGDAVIVVFDHEGESYIAAYSKNTGDLLWKKDRDEGTAWATPAVVEVDGKTQVITSATSLIRSYDAKTGDLIWQCSGQVANVIPSPVLGHGMVFCTSGYQGASLQAIKLEGASGDLSGTKAVKWHVTERNSCPYVASPLLYEGKIYVIGVLNAVISCFDAETGKANFMMQKLDGMRQIYSSPVGAAGRVYFVGRNGTTVVIKNTGKFEVLATNVLDDPIDCSPAIVGNEMYLKGKTHLYCIAENTESAK